MTQEAGGVDGGMEAGAIWAWAWAARGPRGHPAAVSLRGDESMAPPRQEGREGTRGTTEERKRLSVNQSVRAGLERCMCIATLHWTSAIVLWLRKSEGAQRREERVAAAGASSSSAAAIRGHQQRRWREGCCCRRHARCLARRARLGPSHGRQEKRQSVHAGSQAGKVSSILRTHISWRGTSSTMHIAKSTSARHARCCWLASNGGSLDVPTAATSDCIFASPTCRCPAPPFHTFRFKYLISNTRPSGVARHVPAEE